MKATKRDKIALAVAIVLFVLVFVYAVKKLPTVEGKPDGQGNSTEHQSDTKAIAGKWPMKPPVITPMSDWTDPYGQVTKYRYVYVDGKIATESFNSGGNIISFVPETATTADKPK